MTDINPMKSIDAPGGADPVSKQVFHIAGILTTVYGLAEIPDGVKDVACLWLLHPRLQKQETMQPVADGAIQSWNLRLRNVTGNTHPRGLIAVAFDQRNHGSRMVDAVANESWKQGNPRHAQDMFSIYHGTSVDTSLLMNYIAGYAFPHSDRRIVSNLVLGVSLGGHAAWHCILHEPRISAAVVIIGCPDYTRLMQDRATLSKLATWTDSSPPGSTFLGSKDFPPALIDTVRRWDPVGFLGGGSDRQRFAASTQYLLSGKKILIQSGRIDKLVPYRVGKPFYDALKQVADEKQDFTVQDVVYDKTAHTFSPEMKADAEKFILGVLEEQMARPIDLTKESKI